MDIQRNKRKLLLAWNKYKHFLLLPSLILVAAIYSYAVIYGGGR